MCSKLIDGKACPHPGRWMPVLLIRAWVGHPPGRAEVHGITLCDPCKETAKAADFITDQGWGQICEGLRAAGRAVPTRKLTGLDFEISQ